jgi:hypothetical protein
MASPAADATSAAEQPAPRASAINDGRGVVSLCRRRSTSSWWHDRGRSWCCTPAGDIKLELELEKSPQTALNFSQLRPQCFLRAVAINFADPPVRHGGGFTRVDSKRLAFNLQRVNNACQRPGHHRHVARRRLGTAPRRVFITSDNTDLTIEDGQERACGIASRR